MTTIALRVAYLGQPLEIQLDDTRLVYDGYRFVPAVRATRVVLVVSLATSALAPISYEETNTPPVLAGSIPNQIVCGVLGSVSLTGTPPSVVQTPAIVGGVSCSLLGTEVQGVSIVTAP